MAEIAVSLAIDKLLPLVTDEANLLRGISKEFKDIQIELQYIQGSLENTDRRASSEEGDNANKAIKTWVKELREASFRIEDVIDEYIIYVQQRPRDPGCASSLRKVIHFFQTLKRRHQIASEIQNIKSFVQGIKQRGEDYHYLIQPSLEQGSSSYRGRQSVQWHDPRLASRYLDEADVVGFEDPRDELIRWLVDGPAERTVISVVGMGGLGKTTLANRVFNNQKVVAHFGGCRAWITVSQSYTVEGLMIDLLKKLYKDERKMPPQDIYKMDHYSLTNEVRSHLQQKRYVVIFDDVWSVILWDQIENAMLDTKNGSRILITTRMDGVVESCMKSPSDKVHKLKPLTQEESMQLFCKKAFRCHNNERCPEDLQKISFDFVEKCKGLPLAIVAIGSLLSSKEKSQFEWKKIRKSLSSEMDKNPHLIGITKILGFSYDDLPYYLKSCFLYFGAYPEDYEVQSTRLIRQWIAEGFVKDEEGRTLEDIAQQYLSELIGRGLVQVSSFSLDGKAKRCRVHHLLHEMILRKSKDSSFCKHIGKEDESLPSEMIRRLSIGTISNDLMMSRCSESLHTRSLLVFAKEEDQELTKNFLQRIPTNYSLLKVFDFEDGRLPFHYSIPENWINLIHLKYLNLGYSNIESGQLSKLICKLHNLETLDVRHTYIREMPKEVCNLKNLRHLLVDDMEWFELKNALGGLTSLQTLCHVYLSNEIGKAEAIVVELIRELGKLKQLRKLSLKGVKEEHGSSLCSSINEITNLEKLYIGSKHDEVIDLPIISSLPMLRKLSLAGELKMFPKWIPQLQSLVKLTLRCSGLTDDPLKSLQNMPHLLFLEITLYAYEGESLYFEEGGFQQLRILYLGHMLNLKSITIDKGALLSLEELHFSWLPQLKSVPPGIQHLKKLQFLSFQYIADEFNKCIAPNGGPEHPSIQHVPLVKITTFGDDGNLKTQITSHSRH